MKKKSLNSKTLSLDKIKISKLTNPYTIHGGIGTASFVPDRSCPDRDTKTCSNYQHK
ncbi:hypothetical protein [Aquimarina sp. AU474]|uniref:hypothetical protein n=1 Tax=Aquimarina sp. AU474 TaxID=2108529 RepID=UPI00135814AA|nr:hypothetical protein [Aquimarina sp. AU474]